MLALQTLTIALTLSYANADPAGGSFRMVRMARVAEDSEPAVARRLDAPSAIVHSYVPSPIETSLTRSYYEERATCVDQFVWYCSALGGACIAALPALESPAAVLTAISCVLTAACVGITALIGILCCNGIIKNCAATDAASITKAQSTINDMPLDIQSTLNGQKLDAPFTKDTFKPAFIDQVEATGVQSKLTDADFDTMWKGFMGRLGAGVNSSVDIDQFNDYLKKGKA
ncbi:hypothetical protein C8R43DRAFT_1108051 [Mycena crocata]|nr:hypothetical protein C8R43DRAFT_1108051 [Mycena crocata]